MNSSKWSIIQDFLIVVLSQIAMLAISLCGIRALTSGISPEQYGYASLVITCTILGQGLFFGPLGNSLVRFFGSTYSKGREELELMIKACARHYIKPITIGLLTATTIGMAGIIYGLDILKYTAIGIWVMISGGVLSVLGSILISSRRRLTWGCLQTVQLALRFSLASILVNWVNSSAQFLLLGYTLGNIIACAGTYVAVEKLVKSCEEKIGNETKVDWNEKLGKYSWPFASWAIPSWINNSSSRWALVGVEGGKILGDYSACYQIAAYPITAAVTSAVSTISPIMYRVAGAEGTTAKYKKIEKWCILLFGTAVIGIIIIGYITLLNGDNLKNMLLGSSFRTVPSNVFAILIVSAGINASCHFLSIPLHAREKTRMMVIPTNGYHLISGLVQVIGGVAGGLKGVLGAGVIGAMIHLSVSIYLLNKSRNNG